MTFINAVIIKGETKPFTVSIEIKENETSSTFVPFDLSDYAVKFCIMGSTTADAKELVTKIITQNSDEDLTGQIYNAEGGQFSFVVTSEDTKKVGLGEHPIKIELLDAASLETEFILTEGGLKGEFNSIRVVQV